MREQEREKLGELKDYMAKIFLTLSGSAHSTPALILSWSEEEIGEEREQDDVQIDFLLSLLIFSLSSSCLLIVI